MALAPMGVALPPKSVPMESVQASVESGMPSDADRLSMIGTIVAAKGMLSTKPLQMAEIHRMIATVREPRSTVGKTAVLTVRQVTRIGAFLDWGLEKDLLLPYHEQPCRVQEGEEVLAALYVDKSGRLCATMKVYPYLSTRSPYGIGDEVQGRVYELSDNFGVFVAVDDTYSALIPAREAAGKYTPGQILSLRVTGVKEDGKLDVSDRQKAYLQINEDAEAVLLLIEDYGGVLPFDDKASPEIIKEEAGLTKNAFKRAVGHLLKEKKAEIRDGKIYRI